ncbi:MAG: hypothetical protein EBX69_07825 [Betaproteobacteria bacterium]|nr:hypothetical protein [Betaproteobacteria bacterium]NDA73330.1 hypothetical protein [Betaproteobacteria bacterium]
MGCLQVLYFLSLEDILPLNGREKVTKSSRIHSSDDRAVHRAAEWLIEQPRGSSSGLAVRRGSGGRVTQADFSACD